MAYNETYTSSDASPVVIDFVVKSGAAIVGFATIIGLILLYKWFKTGRVKA